MHLVDSAGVEENALRESRLPAVDVRGDTDVPNARDVQLVLHTDALSTLCSTFRDASESQKKDEVFRGSERQHTTVARKFAFGVR